MATTGPDFLPLCRAVREEKKTRTAAEERLHASALGRLVLELGMDIADFHRMMTLEELSSIADDKNHPIYVALSSLQSTNMRDTMCMPDEDPEVAKIKCNPIPRTNFAIRQYSLPIGSRPGEEDRQAFLLDFYDLRQKSQLKEVPNGYTFNAMSAKGMGMKMQPIVLGPYGTTIAVRGVQFEVKRGDEMLLQFTVRE
ncbi:hypothetical protein B0H12DRAFT_1076711 [Mycena haematopus]|nr:hypothetical protein B0H12DRAFT_1076711 [Mycena haematopus]